MVNKKTVGPVTAGIAGAVVGAATSAAVAYVLTDDKTRKKIQSKMHIAQKYAQETFSDLRKRMVDDAHVPQLAGVKGGKKRLTRKVGRPRKMLKQVE